MCEAKPGPRCATDTRQTATRALATYKSAHASGPAVDPVTAATSTYMPGRDEYGMPLYGAQLRMNGRQITHRMQNASTPQARAAAHAALVQHNENVAAFEMNLHAANREMAAFAAGPACRTDPWTRQECLAQIDRNERDLAALYQ